MNIRRFFAQGLRQQRVDHADHRRVIGRFQQVLDGRHVEHQFGEVEIGFDFVHHLRSVAAGSGVGLRDRRFQLGARHRFQFHPAEAPAHFGDCARHGGIRHPHFNRLAIAVCARFAAAREQRKVARKGIG